MYWNETWKRWEPETREEIDKVDALHTLVGEKRCNAKGCTRMTAKQQGVCWKCWYATGSDVFVPVSPSSLKP